MPESSRGHSQTSPSQRPSRIPRRRATFSSSPGPPAIPNTSAAAQQGLLVPFRQPGASILQDAQGVIVNDGRFVNTRGDVVNNFDFTINFPKPESENGREHPAPIVQPALIEQDERTSTGGIVTKSAIPSGGGDTVPLGSNLTSQSPLTTKTCNEVYEALLEPKRRGYALWIPAPNKNLPFPYQRKGVQIGDVGIITPSGGFSFIFNIRVARDNPINPPSLPEEFVPILPPIDGIDICRFIAFNAGSYLASTSIEKSQDDTTAPGLSFRALASEGAILTMPEGAISEDLENLPRLRNYVADNVEIWYRYINGPRGREAKNGDVRLVVGCDKATSWGMATFSNMTQHTQQSQLKFKPLDGQPSSSRSCGYTWDYSGMADVKVGPDQEEIEELRREDPDDSASREKYLNQCLFARTMNVTLNDDDWERLNKEIGIGYIPNPIPDSKHGTGTPSLSSSSRDPSSIPQPTSTPGNFGRSHSHPAVELTSLGTTASRLTISTPPTATSCHPSRIINKTLLKKFPTAKMVITRDEDWYSCIQEDMTMSSDPEQILASLASINDILEEDGVVYLEPKVTREMKYFADLEKLSIELKQKSSNLEEYLYGVDPRRSTRWNEIVFLLELCRDTLSASASDNSILSRNSLSDTHRIREIEILIGSLLIDELFLDEPDSFGSIYALRPPMKGVEPSSSRLKTFQELSFLLGRDSTEVEFLNSSAESLQNGEIFDRDIGSTQRSKKSLVFSSCFYLMYMALGNFADLEYTIETFRQQKLPDPDAPPSEDVTRRGSPPRPMYQLTSYMQESLAYKSGRDSDYYQSGKNNSHPDHRWRDSGPEPQPDQSQTNQARPSRDDNRLPVGYSDSAHGRALDEQTQPGHFHEPSQYPPQIDPNFVEIAAHKDNVSIASIQNLPISSLSGHPPSPVPSGAFLRHIARMREMRRSSERRQRVRRWGVDIADSSSEITSMTTDSARSIASGGSSKYGSRSSSSTNLTSYFGSEAFDVAKTSWQNPWVERKRAASESSVSQTRLVRKTRLSSKGKERARSLEQDSFSRQIPQTFETDMDYVASWLAGFQWPGETDSGIPSQSCIGESSRSSHWDSSSNDDRPVVYDPPRTGPHPPQSSYTDPTQYAPPHPPAASSDSQSHEDARLSVQHRDPRVRKTDDQVPSNLSEDDYRRGYPGEGSSQSGDPRVQSTSHRPFNFYSYSSTSHSADHFNARTSPTSSYSTFQRRREEEEESSDESESSSGSKTEALDPRTKISGGGDAKSRSKTVPIPIRTPFDGSFDPYAMSISQSSAQQGSIAPDPRDGGTKADYAPSDYRGEGRSAPYGLSQAMSQKSWVGGRPAASDESQSRSGHQEKGSLPSLQESRAGETGGGTSGQPQLWKDNSGRQPVYVEGDSRSSTILGDTSTTPRPSGTPLNPTTSVFQRKEEPSRTKPYDPYLPTDTTQPPRYESQRQENIGARDQSRPSGGDSSSNPSVGAMGSNFFRGRQPGVPPGWAGNLPHLGTIAPPTMNGPQMSQHRSVGEGEQDAPFSAATSRYSQHQQRKITTIAESQVYEPSQLTLPLRVQTLGYPSLVLFDKVRDKEELGLKKNIDRHIPLYMCSNIIDEDAIPLWFPTPIFTPGGGSRGIQLGDLGYFDEEGEFHSIFNIFRSYEDNIVGGGRPPSQPYQHLHLDRNWVRKVDIQRQQIYRSSNIEERDVPHPENPYQFRTYKNTGRSGAIIVLPHGGAFSCIRSSYFSLPAVKRHFRDHAASWYNHALQYLPRKTNGSLILVQATHSARSWGIAAFAEKRDITAPLIATLRTNPANEYQHMWQTNDSKWKTRTGPSSNELANLQGRDPPSNQCIGVIICSLRLDEATWRHNFGHLSIPPSVLDRGGRTSRDSWSAIRVEEHSGGLARRIRDSLWGRPTSIDQRYTQASEGDDYALLF